ncbi:coiled-coil domain-containing protein [Maledivibacter halophilus]|uniref:Chromosome segregation ATPase n=1 Tax=Maledivibacter halophilus TaxID=36842 RepID=A0A1T5IA96_9FIRM|nr:hypothetical protein [Maledivibacter halophilus]SKC36105.1 hypothetical protein SAMN02194393_00123 [Maledivibacter halophilus]
MPRISKIRIVGCKYDKFRKRHEDSLFDLTRGNIPDHALFTLKNQGGKGVLMQLISQIALPETKWGKRNGNKLISMFYDQREILHNYTFHILLEWKLDEVPDKWLITGMCITSVKRNTVKDDELEERAGLNYFLYTHEHNYSGPYYIENIPVYDKQNREALDYKDFEGFINDNSRDFIKFSKTSTKRYDSNYYNYLKSKGINRSEWEILKEINRVEGGIGEYFSRAVDNKSIFDKLIIPAITQNMKNFLQDEDNTLVDMFKSELSITKNLPQLLAREVDYKNLIFHIDPLIKDAETGMKRRDMLKRNIIQGNNLYKVFNERLINSENELQKWINEEETAYKLKEELAFKKRNLEYAVKQREIETLKIKERDLISRESQLNLELNNTLMEISKYKINRLFLDKKEYLLGLEKKKLEKNKLIENLNIKDIKKEISNIENEIKRKWSDTKKKWSNIEINHISYNKYLKDEIERLNDEDYKLREAIGNINLEIKSYKDRRDKLSKRENKLAQKHGMFLMSFPEKLLKELEEKNNSEKENIDNTEDKIEKLKDKINEKKISNNKIDLEIKALERDIENYTQEYNSVSKEERKIESSIMSALNINENITYSEGWVKSQKNQLIKLIKDKEERIINLNRELWENNIDKVLNNEDFWIANNDIIILKEEIVNLGIPVQLGTEFLKTESSEKCQKLVNTYPSLIYGLVIPGDNDWNTIKRNISTDILLHNPVPIFIRNNMNKDYKESFKIIENQGTKLVIDEFAYDIWKKDLMKNENNIKSSIEVLKEKVKNIRNIIENINIVLNKKSSQTLMDIINQAKYDLDEFKTEKSHILDQINKTKDKISTEKQNLKDIKKINEITEKDINELCDFIEEKEELDNLFDKMEKNRELVKKLNNEIEDIAKKSKSNRDLILDDNIKYNNWKSKIDIYLDNIRGIMGHAKIVIPKEIEKNHIIPNYSLADEEIIIDLNLRKKLHDDINNMNAEIRIIDKDIEIIEGKISEVEEKLKKIDDSWFNFILEDITITEAEENLSIYKNRKSNIGITLENIKTQRVKVKATLDEKIKNMDSIKTKINEEYPNKALIELKEENLGELEYKINRSIIDNKRYIKEIKSILKDARNKVDVNRQLLSEIKSYKELNINAGKVDKEILEKVNADPQYELEKWIEANRDIRERMTRDLEESKKNMDEFSKHVKSKVKDDILKNKILIDVEGLVIDNYKSNYISFNSMKEYFNIEINTIHGDKEKAEEARDRWANRAAIHGIKMVNALKEMVSSVVYLNERGYSFPLVKLKGEELLPKDEDEIIMALRDYFVQCIEKLLKEYEDIDNIEDGTIEKLMNDKAIFSKTVGGRYPKLMVYKMTEKNEFKYSKPRDYYYESWEAINKGEGVMTEGSGGQTLSISTFVIMMLMNYKKRYIGNNNPWTVLMIDNIFGKASGRHVLDPIFEIANQLNFQLIAFAAPEIIKAEISERFPVFWALNIADGGDDMAGSVKGKVIHGGRIIG